MSVDLTKAELLDALNRTRYERDKAHDALTEFDREARAIAKCVAALDPIQPQRGSSGYPLAMSDSSVIARTLHYLAERYGVPLVQKQYDTVPCDRPHLEDASEGQLVEALRYRR